jgi:hypothetical protein
MKSWRRISSTCKHIRTTTIGCWRGSSTLQTLPLCGYRLASASPVQYHPGNQVASSSHPYCPQCVNPVNSNVDLNLSARELIADCKMVCRTKLDVSQGWLIIATRQGYPQGRSQGYPSRDASRPLCPSCINETRYLIAYRSEAIRHSVVTGRVWVIPLLVRATRCAATVAREFTESCHVPLEMFGLRE